MKRLAVATLSLMGSLAATSAFAFDVCAGVPAGTDPNCPTAVPEISAMEGTAALAAVAALVLIAWERRRRRS